MLRLTLAAIAGCRTPRHILLPVRAESRMWAQIPLFIAACLVATGAISGCQVGDGDAAAYIETENVIKRARDRVYPATVRVEARKTEFFAGQPKRTGGFGSGVIFDDQGHVLTNYHVAGRAEEISCTLYNKERVKARMIAGDPWTDLAVIQLDLDEVREKGFALVPAVFGDSDKVSEGDMVLAIGSPFGLSRSVSYGVVSCHDRILSEAMKLGGGLETGLFNTWLQTDAAINPGNSGGPLVNMHGEVVGINTRGGGNDLGFAVPINVAKDVVEQIMANGKVLRSTIGVTFQPLQDLEGFYAVGRSDGAIISSVEPGSPASAAGILPEDILLEYDGRKVSGRYAEELFELRRMISNTPVGAEVSLKVRRRAAGVDEIVLKTVELTTVRGEEINFAQWGFVGQSITQRLAERENLRDTAGVYVTGSRPGEPAERAGLKRGAVVIGISFSGGGETIDVRDAEHLKELYEESVERRDPMVGLRVRRGLSLVRQVLSIRYDSEPEKNGDAEPSPGPASEDGEEAATEDGR